MLWSGSSINKPPIGFRLQIVEAEYASITLDAICLIDSYLLLTAPWFVKYITIITALSEWCLHILAHLKCRLCLLKATEVVDDTLALLVLLLKIPSIIDETVILELANHLLISMRLHSLFTRMLSTPTTGTFSCCYPSSSSPFAGRFPWVIFSDMQFYQKQQLAVSQSAFIHRTWW